MSRSSEAGAGSGSHRNPTASEGLKPASLASCRPGTSHGHTRGLSHGHGHLGEPGPAQSTSPDDEAARSFGRMTKKYAKGPTTQVNRATRIHTSLFCPIAWYAGSGRTAASTAAHSGRTALGRSTSTRTRTKIDMWLPPGGP